MSNHWKMSMESSFVQSTEVAGREAEGGNLQKKAGPGKETWDLYCTSMGALQEPRKVTVSPGPV